MADVYQKTTERAGEIKRRSRTDTVFKRFTRNGDKLPFVRCERTGHSGEEAGAYTRPLFSSTYALAGRIGGAFRGYFDGD
jgi:hypothetical protein